MSRVILQPSGNKEAREHYKNTIETPVDIKLIKKYVSAKEYQILVDIYGEDSYIPTWGVTPGVSSVNKKKWERIQVGDVALFAAEGKIFGSSVITYKVHNRDLAKVLWDENSKGETWEYIYFLDEVKKMSIPYLEFNKAAGYKTNNVIQGFTVMDDRKSQRVFSAFDLESEIYFPDVTEEEYTEEVLKLSADDNLDKKITGKVRREQWFLRRTLFGRKKIGKCGICNQEYPVRFLVAAHIKKRSKCSNDEKLDYKNVVMPMCRFGCDELFEKGVISVKDGRVIKTKDSKTTAAVEEYIRRIEGSPCDYWNENSAPYFNWHYEQNTR